VQLPYSVGMQFFQLNLKSKLREKNSILKLDNKNANSIFFSCIFLSLTFLNYFSDWWVFKVSGSSEVKIRESSDFADLVWIKSFVACYRKVGDSIYLYDENVPCHLGYFYGSTLIKFFEIVKLDSVSIAWIGLVLTILFCIGLGIIASNVGADKGFHKLFIMSVLFSPGIWLLLERGNLDILIFLLLLAGTQLFSKGNEISGILLIALAALFKFYSLPVLLTLIFITSKRITRIVGTLVTLLVVPKVFLDITSITNPGFPSTWYISFGIESIGLYLNLALEQVNQNTFILNGLEVKLLGYITLILAVILLSKFGKIQIKNISKALEISPDFAAWSFLRNSFWIFGTTSISCYLAGMSYDYRLSFLAVTGLSLITLANNKKISMNRLLILLIIATWCSGSFFPSTSLVLSGLIQLVGDMAFFILSVFFILTFINEIKIKINK
jgi:hypothetical protein